MSKPDMMLWLSDNRGVYIPRDFAMSFADRSKAVNGVSEEDWAILESGPGHEFYWETWDDVRCKAQVTDENGVKYFLNQDGDLWLVPVGMQWNEDTGCFEWPDEDSE